MKKTNIYADHGILAAAVCLLLLYFFAEWQAQTNGAASTAGFSALHRATLLLLICLLFYLGGLLRHDRLPNSRVLFGLMVLFAVLYIYLLVNFTLLDATLRRSANSVYTDLADRRREYINRFVNLRPFQSMWEVYIRGCVRGYLHPYYVFLNLLGNICAFMPFAFFLPLFFAHMRRWYLFLPTVTGAVCTVELMQFAFMVGSCDIDDLILNVGGAMLMYALFKLPRMQRLVSHIVGNAG